MRVKFVYREPGNHTEIYERNLDVIPRCSELVTIGTDTYVVHEVNFILGTIFEDHVVVTVK